MAKPSRQLLVTTALLYANGELHLGHLLEQIKADIFVRFHRLVGSQCHFIGGEDAHGTPIMLAAQRQNINPEVLIDQVFKEHQNDLFRFNINFDHFGTTHCTENEKFVQAIYNALKNNGDITVRSVEQAYDPEKKLFLPDRYIKGTCPRCKTPDQYGDNCEQCGATYDALELDHPTSVLSGAAPVTKSSDQYFLKLSHYQSFLKEWIQQDKVPPQTLHKLLEWFSTENGLHDLSISRETPYFGFRIPETTDKYFYVWIDAPIGYMAIFKQLCQQHPNLDFDNYWHAQTKTELYHVIGKDIVKFHALFWPAMLKSADFRLPTQLCVHGYLTIEGRKMSKSRGTFITAKQYLRHLNPEYLRYYFASKLNSSPEDIDLNWTDFLQKINTDCVGKLVNIGSRCSKLLATHCQNKLSQTIENESLFSHFVDSGERIASYYETQQYSHAIRLIMQLADEANQYLARKQPWMLAKDNATIDHMQAVCTMGLNLFKILCIYLQPVLPSTVDQAFRFLNIVDVTWESRNIPLTGSDIQTYRSLLERIKTSDIESLIQDAA